MREKIRDKERLNHIIESIDNIFDFTANMHFEDFVANKMIKFAVIWNTITEDLQDFKNKIQKIIDSYKQ